MNGLYQTPDSKRKNYKNNHEKFKRPILCMVLFCVLLKKDVNFVLKH